MVAAPGEPQGIVHDRARVHIERAAVHKQAAAARGVVGIRGIERARRAHVIADQAAGKGNAGFDHAHAHAAGNAPAVSRVALHRGKFTENDGGVVHAKAAAVHIAVSSGAQGVAEDLAVYKAELILLLAAARGAADMDTAAVKIAAVIQRAFHRVVFDIRALADIHRSFEHFAGIRIKHRLGDGSAVHAAAQHGCGPLERLCDHGIIAHLGAVLHQEVAAAQGDTAAARVGEHIQVYGVAGNLAAVHNEGTILGKPAAAVLPGGVTRNVDAADIPRAVISYRLRDIGACSGSGKQNEAAGGEHAAALYSGIGGNAAAQQLYIAGNGDIARLLRDHFGGFVNAAAEMGVVVADLARPKLKFTGVHEHAAALAIHTVGSRSVAVGDAAAVHKHLRAYAGKRNAAAVFGVVLGEQRASADGDVRKLADVQNGAHGARHVGVIALDGNIPQGEHAGVARFNERAGVVFITFHPRGGNGVIVFIVPIGGGGHRPRFGMVSLILVAHVHRRAHDADHTLVHLIAAVLLPPLVDGSGIRRRAGEDGYGAGIGIHGRIGVHAVVQVVAEAGDVNRAVVGLRQIRLNDVGVTELCAGLPDVAHGRFILQRGMQRDIGKKSGGVRTVGELYQIHHVEIPVQRKIRSRIDTEPEFKLNVRGKIGNGFGVHKHLGLQIDHKLLDLNIALQNGVFANTQRTLIQQRQTAVGSRIEIIILRIEIGEI